LRRGVTESRMHFCSLRLVTKKYAQVKFVCSEPRFSASYWVGGSVEIKVDCIQLTLDAAPARGRNETIRRNHHKRSLVETEEKALDIEISTVSRYRRCKDKRHITHERTQSVHCRPGTGRLLVVQFVRPLRLHHSIRQRNAPSLRYRYRLLPS